MKTTYLLLVFVLFGLAIQAQGYDQEIQVYREQQAQHLKKSAKGPVADEYVAVHVHYFKPTPLFRVEATVEYLDHEPTFRMPTLDGTSKEFRRYAHLHFRLDGKDHTLTAYENATLFPSGSASTFLFLPFLDLSTGETTYESGRYLDLKKQDIQDEKVILDFNKAYNPYCAYSSGYRCPQPPAENFLQINIEAGEKKYTGPKNQKEQDNSMAKNFTEREKKIISAAAPSDKMYVLQTNVEPDSIILRATSEDIKYDDPLLPTLTARMYATVQDPEHAGVGIAAPQVGINKNIIWVQRFDKQEHPFEVYLNPKIIWRSKLLRKGMEGCLSIPNLREDVVRSYSIEIQYTNKAGKEVKEVVEGFTAVIFQHEVDHLYGILFPDRIVEQEQREETSLADKIEFSIEKGTIVP